MLDPPKQFTSTYICLHKKIDPLTTLDISRQRGAAKGTNLWFTEVSPGRMIANSIPARLVATRMRVVWPRARACPCHVRVRLDLPCTCARMCHAQ